MTGLVLIIVMLGLMWAVVVLPQQRRVKAHQRLCDRIDVGHVVMTTAGLYGTVVEAGTDRLVLEPADGVRLVVDRRSVGMLVPDGTTLADLADVSRPTPEPVPPGGTTMAERFGLGAATAGSSDGAADADGGDSVEPTDGPTDGPSDPVAAADDPASATRAAPAAPGVPATERVESEP